MMGVSCIFYILLFQKFEKIMEGVKKNEPNAIEVRIDSTMTREEVVAKVLQNV